MKKKLKFMSFLVHASFVKEDGGYNLNSINFFCIPFFILQKVV